MAAVTKNEAHPLTDNPPKPTLTRSGYTILGSYVRIKLIFFLGISYIIYTKEITWPLGMKQPQTGFKKKCLIQNIRSPNRTNSSYHPWEFQFSLLIFFVVFPSPKIKSVNIKGFHWCWWYFLLSLSRSHLTRGICPYSGTRWRPSGYEHSPYEYDGFTILATPSVTVRRRQRNGDGTLLLINTNFNW